MSTVSPEELALWCQRTLPDDTRGFEALVARYKKQVFSTAYRLMGNRQEAEDQAQEVFLKIYRGIKSLAEPATLPAWVHRITVNTCLDALERRKRRPASAPLADPEEGRDEAAAEFADTRTPTPAEAAERRELLRCLEKALALLDADGYRVILLRDIEEAPYEEIAGALKIGLSAVKMRIHRARLKLQQLLEQVCPWVGGRGAARAGAAAGRS